MREEGFVAGTEDVRLTIEILVPSAQVGRIIGKGGQNVRELQRVTGSVIKLSEQQSTSPSADEEATVHIIGPFFSVQVSSYPFVSRLLANIKLFVHLVCHNMVILIVWYRLFCSSVGTEKNSLYGTAVWCTWSRWCWFSRWSW